MKKAQVLFVVIVVLFFACGGLKDFKNLFSSSVLLDKPKPIAPALDSASMVYSDAGLIFPVFGKTQKHIISKFGDPRDNGARVHEGIDIAAEKGTVVLSVSDGKVVNVKDEGRGGKQVWVHDRERGHTYYYAHLNSQFVLEGDRVQTGSALGTVGNTGNASTTIPHLHFAVYENEWLDNDVIDPLPLLP